MGRKMSEKIEKLLEEINKKLDAIILLNLIEDLSGKDRLNILKHSIGIKPASRILERDKSAFKKKLKNKNKKNDE